MLKQYLLLYNTLYSSLLHKLLMKVLNEIISFVFNYILKKKDKLDFQSHQFTGYQKMLTKDPLHSKVLEM